MTDKHTGIDTSAEAVERLARQLDHSDEYEPLGHDGWTAAAALRALSAELTAAREALLQYIPTEPVECRGDRCREQWCVSCFGEERANAAITAAKNYREVILSALRAPTTHDDGGGV